MAVNLNFSGAYTPPAANNVRLNFGASGGTGVVAELRASTAAPVFTAAAKVTAKALLAASTAAPVFAAALSFGQKTATLRMAKAAPVFMATAAVDNQLSAVLSGAVSLGWQQAAHNTRRVGSRYQSGALSRAAWALQWRHARPANITASSGFGGAINRRNSAALGHKNAAALYNNAAALYGDLLRRRLAMSAAWGRGVPVSALTVGRFAQLLFKPYAARLPHKTAARCMAGVASVHEVAAVLDQVIFIPWQRAARTLPAGRSPPYKPVPVPRPPYVPSADLNFVCGSGVAITGRVDLNFTAGVSCPTVRRRAYIVQNAVYCKRLADDLPIDLLSCSLGIDRDSFAWSFSAALPYSEAEKVVPTAAGLVEIEVGINGIVWRFIVEGYAKKSRFARTEVTITGRSLTAYLAEPYAARRNYDETGGGFAAAMAAAELERGGVPSGFSLDWRLIDALGWAVPAGTLNYDNLTPVQAVQKIAQGGGGFVQSHTSEPVVLVLPDYPVAPWGWPTATVNKTVLLDLVKSEALQWQERPDYNGVYVAGVVSGVTAFVKREGSAGENQAPPWVDRMTCDAAAARQVGLSILAQGGKQAKISLDLPLHNSLGLITPAMLVEVADGVNSWRGLVRGVSISVAASGLSVTQSIELERHYL